MAVQFGTVIASNFGPFESMELNLRDRGLLLVLGDNQDTTAADNNGSGKSHILKAISWCLWGETPDSSDKADSLTRKRADQISVTINWEDPDGIWSVTRTKKRGSSVQLVFEHNDQDISAPVVASTQAEIGKRLGLDFQTWRNTVLYAQGDIVRFADPSTTDSERKAVLKRILRLDVLDRALKSARDKLSGITKRLSDLMQEASNIHSEIRGLDASIDLEADAKAADHEAKQHDAKAGKLGRLRAVASEIQSTIADIRSGMSEADEARDEYAKQNAEAAAAQTRAFGASNDRKRAAAGLATFAKGACPTCGTKSSAPGIKAKCTELSHALAAADEAIAAAEAEAQAAAKLAAAAKARGESIKSAVDQELVQWYDKLRSIQGDITLAEQSLTLASDARRRANAIRQKVKAIDGRREKLAARAAEIIFDVEALEAEKLHVEFWVKGFSNAGLSSHVMDNIMPALTERANHYLDILADGDIQVNFDTQSKLKSGEAREKLSIGWIIEGEADTTPSGGQRKKISIAVDLALMDLVASRERSAIDLLLMDEMLDGLDATGRSRVMTLLTELRSRRSTIVVISHDSDIAELFEQLVTVRKVGRVATLVEG
jgi:DNA repair exonuclease SbcCD ATPase subunit